MSKKKELRSWALRQIAQVKNLPSRRAILKDF